MTEQVTTLEGLIVPESDPRRWVDAATKLAGELLVVEPARGMDLARTARLRAIELGYTPGVVAALQVLAYGNIAIFSDHDVGRAQLDECLRIARDLGDHHGEMKALNLLGSLRRRMGNGRGAIACHAEVLEMARANGSREGEAMALNGLGHAYRMTGEVERALEAHRQSLEIAREVAYEYEEASALNGLGNTYEKLGEFNEAFECYTLCLDLAEKIGNRQLVSYASGNIAIIHQRFGDNAAALHFELESLRCKQQLGDRWGAGVSYNNLGIIYKNLGEYANALEMHLESLKITEEIDDLEGQSVSLNNIGMIYEILGDQSKSLDHYQRSLAIAERVGYRQGQAYSFDHIGRIHAEQGDYPRALIHYMKSLQIHRSTGDRYGERSVLQHIGSVHLHVNDLEKAAEHYTASLRIAEETGEKEGQAVTLINLASLERLRGEYDTAARQLHDALEIAQEMGNRDLVGQSLQELARVYEALGDEVGSARFQRMYDEVHRKLFNNEMKQHIRKLIADFERHNAHREAELLGLRQEDLADMDDALRKLSRHRMERMLERAGTQRPADERRTEAGPAIHVQTFAEFRITIGGRELRRGDWHRKRARDLFKLLLLNHGRAVTVDDIAEYLWGGLADRNVEQLVMNAVSHIRKALEPHREPHKPSALLTSGDHAYTLDLGEHAVIDFLRFRSLIVEARHASTTELRRRLYEEAAALHTGEFLKEDLYERWTEAERDCLGGMLFEALTYLGGEYLRETRFEEAIAAARSLLERDAISGKSYELLISALLGSGRIAEARRALDNCTAAFHAELGADPPEHLRRLVETYPSSATHRP